jgi:hypothetical protein
MVGIERYQDPDVPRLYGCRTDIADALEFLSARRGHHNDLDVRELYDDQATGVALVDGFRTHLSKAGPGDTALFWFSGHGSRAAVPPDLWHLEPDGINLQTLVCADSRHDGRPDLLDKELALLLAEVAATGCHVVAVLDSCHSGGATRGPDVRVRAVCPRTAPPGSYLLPELGKRYAAGPPPIRYVSLAACQASQVAGEQVIGGRPRGLFTWALLDAMRRSGPGTTYRELVVLARNGVERLSASQTPQIIPAGPGIAEQPLFGGAISAPPAITMRNGRDGWEIDAGSCHGIDVGTPEDPTRVAVAEPSSVREARVVHVEVRRSLVEPIGWNPDGHTLYPVVVSRVPMPPTTVTIDADVEPAVADRIREALQCAGPAGTASPHVRLVDSVDAELAVCSGSGYAGTVRVADRDRVRLYDVPPGMDGPRTVGALEHIARWRQVKNLGNPVSRLRDTVSIEIVEPLPHERVAPRDRAAVRPDADGAIRLAYHRQDGGWVAPTRFIRLRNTAPRPLYCVLLDLTDRFRIHADLFRGAEIAAGSVAAVGEGARIEFALPVDRPVEPGARVCDWLMLIVAEDEVVASPFELTPIGTPGYARSRGVLGVQGLVERLGRGAVHRDIRPAPVNAYEWWTLLVPVITEVPREG